MDANALLMGSGGDYIKFDRRGVVQGGTILSLSVSQQTDINTKDPLTWPDGKAKMQVIVSLQTDLRNPENPSDTGMRDLYVKGKNLTNAVRDAVKAVGATGLAQGGILQVCYTGDDMTSRAPIKPKMYQARYAPPVVSIGSDFGGQAASSEPNWGAAATQATPAHHEQGPVPAWADEKVSATPDAPAMSTLAAIKASQADPTMSNQHQPGQGFTKPVDTDPFGDEPPF